MKLAHSKFHGTAHVSEIGALQVPWNSMELLMSAKLEHLKFHGIPWNSMGLRVSVKLAHSKFHGIPWNYSCQRNWRTPISMELHGIPWNCSCQRNWRTWSSMEFHVTAGVSSMEFHGTYCYLMESFVSSMHWVLKWDKIQWNLSFQILMKIIFNFAGLINFRKLINTLYLLQVSFTN